MKERNQNAGSGVGLAAVKAEVDALDGFISVESEYGCGTTFTITLPDEQDGCFSEETADEGIDEIMEDSFMRFAEEYIEKLQITGRIARRACLGEQVDNDGMPLEVCLGMRVGPTDHIAQSQPFDLSVMFSIPYRVALVLYDGFNDALPHDGEESCTKEALRDTMSEILNNMCGNWSKFMEGYSMVLLPYKRNEHEAWKIVKEIGQDGDGMTIRISGARKVKG